jgi:hypothetical protein
MKAISASIVVLAGAIVFAQGVTIQHSDTQLFVCLVGGALGLAGLSFWMAAILNKSE